MGAFKIGAASAALLIASACGERKASAAGNCAAAAGDSARAACVAVDTVTRASSVRSRVLSTARTGAGFRIRTVPADTNTLDGMGVVLTDSLGRVVSVTIGDSL